MAAGNPQLNQSCGNGSRGGTTVREAVSEGRPPRRTAAHGVRTACRVVGYCDEQAPAFESTAPLHKHDRMIDAFQRLLDPMLLHCLNTGNRIPRTHRACMAEPWCHSTSSTLLKLTGGNGMQAVWCHSRGSAEAGRIARAQASNSLEGVPCLLYTSPSPRDATLSRMPSSA